MTLLVPFDGSDLATTALTRATEFGATRDEEVVVLTVVPDDSSFAVERGWINAGEPFDIDQLCENFEQRVAELAPEARFRCETPTENDALTATAIDDITRTVRRVAGELDVSIIFIGTENAGRISTPVTSVGSPLSKDPQYDVHIVRHAE